MAWGMAALTGPAFGQVRGGSAGSAPFSVGRGLSDAGNTSNTDSSLCPARGPVILGIDWNCVAVLDLTELALFFASIGIIAYVFRDSDQAELPGDSTEVPMTAEEEATYQRSRELGIPYRSPEPEQEKGGD